MTEAILFLIIAVLIWGVIIYNLLIRDKNRVLQSWSDIDVQLKRRHDLIPKLVDAINAYARYERSTLDEITRLRTAAETAHGAEAHSAAETALTGKLQRLIAIAEDYPELKADAQYLDLLRQISDVENHIQYARRYYNGSVNNLNVRIDSFPDTLIAGFFKFKHAEFFQFDTPLNTQAHEG